MREPHGARPAPAAQQSFFGFGPAAQVEIVLDDKDTRRTVEINLEGKKETLYLFADGETIKGQVEVKFKQPGKKFEHMGIRIELMGHIEMFYDRAQPHEFISLVRELSPPGELTRDTSYPFEFADVELPHESYNGVNVRLRYVPGGVGRAPAVVVVVRACVCVRSVDRPVQLLSARNDPQEAGKNLPRHGLLGPQVLPPAGSQQQHQDGSWH